MTISPRTDEVATVQALLESDEYEDSKAMARAIVKAIAEEFAHRDTLLVAWAMPPYEKGDLVIEEGPFYHAGDAQRHARARQEGGLLTHIRKLYKPMLKIPALGAGMGLCECGHGAWIHQSPYGCGVITNKKKCECRSLALREEDKERWEVA